MEGTDDQKICFILNYLYLYKKKIINHKYKRKVMMKTMQMYWVALAHSSYFFLVGDDCNDASFFRD